MKVQVLSWNEVDLDVNEEKIAEELHKELDRQLDVYGIDNNRIEIDVDRIVNDLIVEEFDKKNIQFEDYEIID